MFYPNLHRLHSIGDELNNHAMNDLSLQFWCAAGSSAAGSQAASEPQKSCGWPDLGRTIREFLKIGYPY